MVQRKKHRIIAEHLFKKEFTILIGARQIGKSTLLKQLFEDLNQIGEVVFFLTQLAAHHPELPLFVGD